jgi:hypothetical protein
VKGEDPMLNPIPTLPDPLCGATLPDGGDCPSPSTVTIAAEHPTGNALLVWRCGEHITPAVGTCVQTCPDSIVTVTPLALIEQPPPSEPAPPAKPQLHLVHG